MWGHGSRHAPAVTPGSSSWAIARATAPKWLGSNCWVRDGVVGERRERQGGPRSPFSLGCLRHPIALEAPGADAQPPRGPVHHRAHALQARIPAPVRLVVRVADVVPRDGALAPDFPHSRHGFARL